MLRKKTHSASPKSSPDHLYIPKEIFEEEAAKFGFTVRFFDHDKLGLKYATAPYRYSCYCVRKLHSEFKK